MNVPSFVNFTMRWFEAFADVAIGHEDVAVRRDDHG